MKIRSIMALALGAAIAAPSLIAQANFEPMKFIGDPAVPAWTKGKQGAAMPAFDEKVTPATPPPAGLYVALGDSITWGRGVTINCQPFPAHPVDIASYCPDGTTYPVLVAMALRKAGIAGHFMNMGISGGTVDTIIANELPYLPAETTLVTISIGGNDSRFVRRKGMTVKDNVKLYEDQYMKLLDMVHQRAPKARIVLVNIPNYGTISKLGSRFTSDTAVDQQHFDATSQLMTKFVDSLYPKYAVADTMCQAYSYDMSVHFEGSAHMTEPGYAQMAKSVLSAIQNPAPPPAKCDHYDAAKADALMSMK